MEKKFLRTLAVVDAPVPEEDMNDGGDGGGGDGGGGDGGNGNGTNFILSPLVKDHPISRSILAIHTQSVNGYEEPF